MSVPLAGHRIRALVAVLALRAGEPVPVWRIIEALWEGDPPAGARNQVQVYISRIRKALLAAGCVGPVVRTRGEAYLLDVEPDRVDALRFARLVAAAEARRTRDAGPVEEADLLREALALWRGNALADVAGAVLGVDAAALEDVRCAAQERRVDLDLARGCHGDLVAELRGAVAERPLHEGFRRRLMLALAGCGQPAEALATYREGQRLLRDELGLDPSEDLQETARSILRRTAPRPDRPGDQRVPVGGRLAAVISCSLPPAVAGFVGRGTEASELRAGLDRVGDFPAVALVTGAGGIGKSTLGIRVAHELRGAYPDGQLFIDLRGSQGDPMPPREALGHLLRGLGVTGALLPDDLTERLLLYRSMAADRRILVMLDDAAHEHQVRPLVPGAGGSAVLLTSRSRLVGLDDATRVELGVLARAESLRLLGSIAGEDRLAAAPVAAGRIARLCGDHPLAVRIAAARLAERPHLQPGRLAAELSDERARLDALRAGDLEVRATLAVSYGGLTDAERRAVRLLSLGDVPDFPAWAAACVLDLPPDEAEGIVERVADARLLDPVVADSGTGEVRFRFHELVRLFGRERAAAEETPAARAGAVRRLLAGYLVAAEEADRMATGIVGAPPLDAPRYPLPDDRLSAVRADPPNWFARELAALVALVRQAATVGEAVAACGLAASMAGFLETRNFYDHWSDTHTQALAAARAVDAVPAILAMVRNLGELHTIRDEHAAAVDCFTEALALSRQTGDLGYAVAALVGLGYLQRLAGHYTRSIASFTAAAEAARRDGNRNGEIYAEQGVGAVWFEQGRLDQAATRYTECLRRSRAAGYRAVEAQALRGIGLVQLARGEPAEAAESFRQAREISAALGDRLVEAYAVQLLGHAHALTGEYARAEALLRQADRVFERFDSRFGLAMVLVSLATMRLGQHRVEEARGLLERACGLWRRLGMPYWGAQALDLLAEARRRTGDGPAADRAAAEARALRLTCDAESVRPGAPRVPGGSVRAGR
ncbi:AfsR/SARP family transcriptional regulator [Plantactinospora soyae]|uniref:DNA-binding SARP family transcriptional activator/tetratricopeptide (TPR) repeat protein n=1 Tax=Plantactinospora soyae TaxID=1544732 RepID=A0A927M5X2_9ACTN|nr:BTAD domain-containing putative transcriptional regulator [Plantactinospora soyae]MBE1488314.1 DNA-binding SARP family transcriptional activator/tetratricopeptide (TPR) repeat protein [Plantactinospora soyae]